MDGGTAHVVYYSCSATEDVDLDFGSQSPQDQLVPDAKMANIPPALRRNIETFGSVFKTISLCHTASSCLSKIKSLYHVYQETGPTIVVIETPAEESISDRSPRRELPRSPSPKSGSGYIDAHKGLDDPGGLAGPTFLPYLNAEVRQLQISAAIVPVVVLGSQLISTLEVQGDNSAADSSQTMNESIQSLQYMDAGAVDVLISPFTADRVRGLTSHAYRAFKDVSRQSGIFAARQGRSKSWVGVNDTKPYAYLREKMVSGLMARICNPDHAEDAIDPSLVELSPDRRAVVAEAVGSWKFSGHDFTDDELLYGCYTMLQHALKMPELEKWRMTDEQLITFLIASRRVYNSFVLYHNFRHACDVLQAVFYFLMQVGAIPELGQQRYQPQERSPLASLLQPFHALTLLIAAIGHDVGHPGVNNSFLVTLNAPLAQLYNDRSVLESFHCAAYSQILRRYWPVAFSDITMRKLMINSILATDMGIHVQYMTQLGNLQEKFHHNNNITDGWNDKSLEECRDLLCCLLIKCADICNVARDFKVATQWASILTDEFCNQGAMEQELHMPTCLFGGPPDRDDIIKMGSSQIGFMNIFASPLFGAVSEILPAMKFTVDQIEVNKTHWQDIIAEEKQRRKWSAPSDGTASPRSTTGPTDVSSSGEKEGQRHEQTTSSSAPPRAHFNMTPSEPTSRKESISHISGLEGGFDPSRRASLGPTVVPNRAKRDVSPRNSSEGGSSAATPSRQQNSPNPTSDRRHLDRGNSRRPSWRQSATIVEKKTGRTGAKGVLDEKSAVSVSSILQGSSTKKTSNSGLEGEGASEEPVLEAESYRKSCGLSSEQKAGFTAEISGVNGPPSSMGRLKDSRKRSFASLKFWKRRMYPDKR